MNNGDFCETQIERIIDIIKSARIDKQLEKDRKNDNSISEYAWLSSYQIAKIFSVKYPEEMERCELVVGGKNSGSDVISSLAWHISNGLINNLKLPEIEYSQLSKEANEVIFGKDTLVSDKSKNTNLFRYKANNKEWVIYEKYKNSFIFNS